MDVATGAVASSACAAARGHLWCAPADRSQRPTHHPREAGRGEGETAGAAMIVQANEPVTFSSTSRIVLPLESPTLAGSILVLAVVMDGRTPGLRISDDLGMPRWRQANCD